MKFLWVTLAVLLLSIASAGAMPTVPDYTTACYNSTDVVKSARILNTSDSACIICSTQITKCTYGCNSNIGICNQWPGQPMPMEYMIIFEVSGLAIFFLILFRADVTAKEVSIADIGINLMAIWLLFSLALQANNVIEFTTGEAVQIVMMVWINYGLAILSVVFFFFNMWKFVGASIKAGRKL